MDNLPFYISLVFILTTFLCLFLLYKASHGSRPVMVVILFWLALQAVLSLSGFYTVRTGAPPGFVLVIAPPIVLIVILFLTKKGRQFADGLDAGLLTLLHIIRIPVELTLFWLFLHKAVPGLITFEGRNFDIFCGLTAPFVYYFGYFKKVIGRKFLIAWNGVCLLLLANVVVMAVLSAPLPFQQFAFDQPNIALFYFPFVWLPGCLVPVVLYAHLATIRQLLK